MIIQEPTKFPSYAEIPQTNPIRWRNLKPTGDGNFEAVSGWWKCKDFQNEVVASFHTKENYSIYSFTVNYNTFFAPGQKSLYFEVKNLVPGFWNNLQHLQNYLQSEGAPQITITKLDEERAFIELPEYYLTNTYFISVITLLIRMTNTMAYPSWETLVANTNEQDSKLYRSVVAKPLSKFPENKLPYLYHYSPELCFKKGSGKVMQTSLLHNCGVVGWAF